MITKLFFRNALFFIVFAGIFHQACFGQNTVQIIGPTTVPTNNQVLYSVNFYSNGFQIAPPTNGTSHWDNSGATIIHESSLEYRLNFTTPGSHWVYFEYSTFDGYISDILYINAESDDCNGIVPSAEDVERNGSGTVTLVADTAPAGFGYEWYNSAGTTMLSGNQSFTTPELSSTTTYQLAYKHTSSGCLTDKVTVTAIISDDDNDYNYVKRYLAQIPTSNVNTVKEGENAASAKNFTYYDGLGRPMQQIQKQASASGQDIILPIIYDDFGRQSKSHLPYSRNNGSESGNYRETALAEQKAFYDSHYGGNTGNFAFSETEFESSPLHRVVATYAPGQVWANALDGNGQSTGGENRPVKVDYLVNDSLDRVILWEEVSGSLVSTRFYEKGTLHKTVSTDEEGHQRVEFKDLQGRTVLNQAEAPGGTWARTYYVYDDLGNLIYVLPPETLGNYNVSGGITMAAGDLDQWAFRYKYDERQRLTEKKVPGADEVYLVYDRLDRLVLSQDGVQRKNQKWSFTKYDVFGRVVLTGEKALSGSLSAIRSAVAAHTVLWETYTGSGMTKYSDNAYPTSVSEPEILTVTYYDSYGFTTKTFGLQPELDSSTDGKVVPQPFLSVRGQVTGTKLKILGTDADYIETVNFYDDRYRLIQSKVENSKGAEDVISTQYDFAGRMRVHHQIIHNPEGEITFLTLTREYDYDHAGRLLTLTHQIENYPKVTLVSNTYNELGELTRKDIEEGIADIGYTYNIRGWLTGIQGLSTYTHLPFGMELEYDNAPAGHRAYNGNIGAIVWTNPYESLVNRYNYSYDEMDRLTLADYSNGGASNMGFDVSGISYDLNGNIKTLERKGNDELYNPNVSIDQLTYTYASGNQLSKVSDASGKTVGFADGTDQTTEYLYDENGNMTGDRNKGISSIEYNILNLPAKVSFSATDYIEYTYDAAGTKLSQKTVEGENVKVTDYLGEIVFENDSARYVLHDEGRAVVRRNDEGVYVAFRYLYDMKDHLGNVRFTYHTGWDPPAEYLATFEDDPETRDYEQSYFSRYEEITRINADIFDHTDEGSDKTFSMRLNGTGNEVYGLAKSLEVKPGDQVSAVVWAKYLNPSNTGTSGTAFAQLIEDLSNNSSSVVVDAINPGSQAMPPFVGMAGSNGVQHTGAPKAYLNMMVFDLNFQQIGNTLYTQISTAAEEDGTDIDHEFIPIWPVTITEPGYVYVYLSNENETPVEVFFDDFQVTHFPSDIVQKDDYYPFGLTFNSYYSGEKNKYLYNGKELLDDLNLNLYDYGARYYDPVIGRWTSPDPMAHLREWVSPYNFVQNNPLNRIDPDGRFDWVANKEGEVYWDENATSQATTKTGETYLGKSGTGIDEQTGNMLVYNSDGSIDQGMMSLGEVTVSATQSDHERTMSNPVVQNMRANSERIKSEALPFARHMVRSAIDGAGYTGAGITALGGVVVPFVPPIGAGLIGVGGSVSTIAGGASTLMYAAEGDYKSAAIEGSLTVSGSVSGRYLQNMASPARGLINSTTDLPILQGLKNTSFDIVNIIIVPKVK